MTSISLYRTKMVVEVTFFAKRREESHIRRFSLDPFKSDFIDCSPYCSAAAPSAVAANSIILTLLLSVTLPLPRQGHQAPLTELRDVARDRQTRGGLRPLVGAELPPVSLIEAELRSRVRSRPDRSDEPDGRNGRKTSK